MNEPIGKYPEVYRRMMTVGLLGLIYRANEDAEMVHAAVEQTLADPTQYHLLRGIALGMSGCGARAKDTFERYLDSCPGDDGIKVAMAVSLMLAGDPEGRRWIDHVLASSVDHEARAAANKVLSYVRSLRFH
jgi:hypothetical protein